MKLYKRSGVYKSSHVTFNPSTMDAYSYDWWRFVARIEGLIVFNSYFYSQSTSKHQRKVKRLMHNLGIKIDIEMPIPSGIQDQSLNELIVEAEECLCNQFLKDQLKQQQRSERAKFRRRVHKLETYLETVTHFRDYEIKPADMFGKYHSQAIHQVVSPETIEADVSNALDAFHRDGFGRIVFYLDAA